MVAAIGAQAPPDLLVLIEADHCLLFDKFFDPATLEQEETRLSQGIERDL